jgi:O-antigen/teichoic acid export membrane protein
VDQAAAGFRAATFVTVILGISMALAAPLLCVTLFGEEFRGSIVELRLLVIGAPGVVALIAFGNVLVAQRRPLLSSLALGSGFLCTIALDIVLIPPYAGIGAAVASAIAYTVAGAVMSVFFVLALGASRHDLVPKAGELASYLSLARASLRRRNAASTKAEDPARVDVEP